MAFNYNNTYKTISFTHPWKGGVFHWNSFTFNGGNPYRLFRFGPLLIRLRA